MRIVVAAMAIIATLALGACTAGGGLNGLQSAPVARDGGGAGAGGGMGGGGGGY